MSDKLNEFYGMDAFVHPSPDITMQGDTMAQQAPIQAPIPDPVQISVSFRDIYTPQESYDPTCMDFKLDMTFIVTVSDMTGKQLESGVVTKRLCLCKQTLASELNCATAVKEEIDLTKIVAAKAQQVIQETTNEKSAEIQARVVKRMRELAGIPHPTNHV